MLTWWRISSSLSLLQGGGLRMHKNISDFSGSQPAVTWEVLPSGLLELLKTPNMPSVHRLQHTHPKGTSSVCVYKNSPIHVSGQVVQDTEGDDLYSIILPSSQTLTHSSLLTTSVSCLCQDLIFFCVDFPPWSLSFILSFLCSEAIHFQGCVVFHRLERPQLIDGFYCWWTSELPSSFQQ